MKVQLDKEIYTLSKKIGEGNFATVYATQLPTLVAKVTHKSNPKAFKAFQIETEILTKVQGEGIVKLAKSGVTMLNNQQVGIMLLENCSKGSLIDLMATYINRRPPEKLVLLIARDITKALIIIHQHGYIHRDVKMENVLLNNQGQFKLCDFGSVTKTKYNKIDNSQRVDVQEEIEENTTPFYRAPEYIDFYANFPINESADMFALGVLLFMFCFQKPPFESGLAAVNNKYFLPDNHEYSPKLIQLIQSLFTVDPRQRPTAKDLLTKISNWQLPARYIDNPNQPAPVPNLNKHFTTVDNVYIEKKEQPLGFFDQVKRYFFTLSKKTEAWVIQSTQNDDEPPRLDDIRSLVVKAWLKREKIPKFYQAIQQQILPHPENQKIMMKLAILIHQYLKKGPPEVLKEQKGTPNIWSVIRVLNEIYLQRLKRNPQSEVKLVANYFILIGKKLTICSTNKKLFEASYSLSPLFLSLERGEFWQPLESKLFDSLLQYWQECLQFFNETFNPTPLWRIQTVIIMQMVDEIYSLLSMLLHLWIAVKETLNTSANIDTIKLTNWILSTDQKYEENYVKTQKLFQKCQQLPEFSDISRFMPKLPTEVISYMQTIEYFTGKTKMELSPARSIHGIKMPVSYQVTLQRLQQELLSMAEFDQPPQQLNSNKDFFADFGFLNQPQEQQQAFDQPWVDFTQPVNNPIPVNNLPDNKESINNSMPNGRESVQTVIDQKVLSQIMFQIDNKPEQTQSINQILQPNMQQSKIIEVDDLLDIQHTQPIKQPQNTDLLDLFDVDDNQKQQQSNFVLPTDINFVQQPEQEEEDLIPMSYDPPPPPPKNLIQSTNPQMILTPAREKIHVQILEHANKIIDGEVDISEFIIQFGQLIFYEQIASGGSGVVYRGSYKNQIVAIKDIDINDQDEQKMKEYKREIVTLVKVRHHQNLVCLVGLTFNQNKLYIVTEFCSGGSLFDLVHRNREIQIDDLTKLKFSLFIASGIAYLHKLGFMHRDLKSLNLLLDQPYSPDSVIKIADFGLARTALEKSEWMTAVVGTFHWMAPEVFKGEMYTNKADVYSFGIVMYEIYSRQIPYVNITNPMQIMKAVTEQNVRPDLNFQCSLQIKQLMMQCWHPDPEQRPSFEQIVNFLQSL